MRQIEDYLNDVPKTLQANNKKTREIAERILNTKRIEKTDYNRAGVKDKLLKIYAYCCAFCEKRIGIADDIEHFRAKHEVSILDNTLKKQIIDHQGYYWLGFEWQEKNIILIRDRQTIINNIRGKVEHAILNYVNEERLYQDLLNIHVKLQEQIMETHHHIRQPFSAVRRACLERFKTFFIDIFEGEHAVQLNKAYDKLRAQLDALQT
jgi:hypothetical protein